MELLDQPTVIDERVYDLYEKLKKVCSAHQQIFEQTNESIPYIPEEIEDYVDVNVVEGLWDTFNYEEILKVYVEAWLMYFDDTIVLGHHFTTEDFVSGKVGRYFGFHD